ncbi:hypothetical protein JTY93_08890 [Pseudomonas hygromyciniae]|uniref:Uncharacterized protein n=1 Tax=Pseudomonas hygromyciniae TaxID=2812000 RepID=A0ABX7K3C4_9PSED|nr:hypothetical protein [Pseudomonas hygromyciniae]MBN0980558.1 hypothetical protein [Pseudomonas hygromyciniae]QSB41453.1 hypothetical protein JTY93_08890 [Pseudomonas hygromyciniae]
MEEQLVLCMLKRRLYIIMTKWQNAKDAITGRLGETYERLALEKALYARNKIENHDEVLIKGINHVYVGHSTVTSVTCLGGVVYIDMGRSFDGGALTIIELNTQANISVSMRAV